MFFKEKLLFTKNECEFIINNQKNNIVKNWNKIDRKFQSQTIILNDNNSWIFNRLKDFFVSETNIKIKKNKDLIHFHKFVKGDWFSEHNDVKENRLYAVGVVLNDDFEGGDFILKINGKSILNKTIGNSYIFDVRINHEVTNILSGERYSLLWFLQAEHLKFENKLI